MYNVYFLDALVPLEGRNGQHSSLPHSWWGVHRGEAAVVHIFQGHNAKKLHAIRQRPAHTRAGDRVAHQSGPIQKPGTSRRTSETSGPARIRIRTTGEGESLRRKGENVVEPRQCQGQIPLSLCRKTVWRIALCRVRISCRARGCMCFSSNGTCFVSAYCTYTEVRPRKDSFFQNRVHKVCAPHEDHSTEPLRCPRPPKGLAPAALRAQTAYDLPIAELPWHSSRLRSRSAPKPSALPSLELSFPLPLDPGARTTPKPTWSSRGRDACCHGGSPFR